MAQFRSNFFAEVWYWVSRKPAGFEMFLIFSLRNLK